MARAINWACARCFRIERRTFALLLIGTACPREEQVASRLSRALGDIPMFGGRNVAAMRFDAQFRRADRRPLSAPPPAGRVPHPFEVFKSEHAAVTWRAGGGRGRRRPAHRHRNQRRAGRRRIRPALWPGLENSPRRHLPHTPGCRAAYLRRSISAVNPDLSPESFAPSMPVLSAPAPTTWSAIWRRTLMLPGSGRSVPCRLCWLVTVFCAPWLSTTAPPAPGCRPCWPPISVVGFNTYGEQSNAMHVNQTFTGIAIGYGLPA